MKHPFRTIPGFALLLILPLLAGCMGYHLGPIPPKFMEGVHTVAIPTFSNPTMVPRLEVLAASCVIKQMQQDGTFKVGPVDESDVIVNGTVMRVYRYGARSVRSDVLKQNEYNLMVTFGYNVTRRSTSEVLTQGQVTGVTSFMVSGNDVNQDEREAIPLALADAAVHLVSHLTEGW